MFLLNYKKIKYIYIIRIIIFFIIIALPLFNINLKTNQTSKIDNKKLIEFSEVFTGDITNNIERFVEERIGFRTDMINVYTRGMDLVFNEMVHPSYEYGKEGYVFGKLSREKFDPSYQEIFSEFIMTIQNYCKNKNIDFLYALEPKKAIIYSEYLPNGVKLENKNTEYFLELLDQKNINYIYTGEILTKAKEDFQVFDKKYDANHWNETGALIAISEILKQLHAMDPRIDELDITNYVIDKVVNTTLPVSYFPIEEETTIYRQNNTNIQTVDSTKENIKLSPRFQNFAHYINKSKPDAPKILVFAGSYFNGKHKFLNESFSEFILVHNYQNIINIGYYIDILQPDIILFESAEYTHNSTYFDYNLMKKIVDTQDLSNFVEF